MGRKEEQAARREMREVIRSLGGTGRSFAEMTMEEVKATFNGDPIFMARIMGTCMMGSSKAMNDLLKKISSGRAGK